MAKRLRPPPDLTPQQASQFLRIARELGGDLAEHVSGDAIALAAVAFIRWRRAESALDLEGDVITAANGYRVRNPEFDISCAAQRQLRTFWVSVERARKAAKSKSKARPIMRLVDDTELVG